MLNFVLHIRAQHTHMLNFSVSRYHTSVMAAVDAAILDEAAHGRSYDFRHTKREISSPTLAAGKTDPISPVLSGYKDVTSTAASRV